MLFQDMSDDEIREAVRKIVSDSSDDEEIQQRLYDELGYAHHAAINSCLPTDRNSRDARAIAQKLGGLIRKDGAMVMIILHGPRGIISI